MTLDLRALVAVLAAAAAVSAPVALAGGDPLPPKALRGNEHRLRPYPAVALATSAERAAAVSLLARIRAAARAWPRPADARLAGFDVRLARRRPRAAGATYVHAEHRRNKHDGRYLDAAAPEALIYANVRGRPLALAGVMFSVPRGVHGPTPGGPITRWHTHTVCASETRRGVAVGRSAVCPTGLARREGSEMLHVWFTGDVRSAFAIHAPEPELCRVGVLPRRLCSLRGHVHAARYRPPVPHPPPRPPGSSSRG